MKILNRRMFLTGMGKSLLAVPFLPSLLPREARAQALNIPPRFIAMSSQNGAVPSASWYPSALPTQISQLMYPAVGGTSYYAAPAHSIHSGPIPYTTANGISKFFDQRFNSYVSKMNFLKGLDWRYSPDQNHVGPPLLGNIRAASSNLAGYTNEFPTIDQIMAYATNFYPNNGVGYVRSIQANLKGGIGLSTGFQNPLQKTGSIVAVPTTFDPKILFNQLFPNAPVTGGGPSATTTPYIDAVLSNFKSVRDGKAIGREDKIQLQAHMDMFADLEKTLTSVTPTPTMAQCTNPTSPAAQAQIASFNNPSVILSSYQAMNSLIALALSCQRTRVASFYISTIPGYEGLGGSGTDQSRWHWATHNIDGTAADIVTSAAHLDSIYSYISYSILLDLLNKLNAITEPNGKTILDNSLFQYSSASADHAHSHRNMPMVLFGSAGGRIKTGQFIDYQNRAIDPKRYSSTGVLINQYFVTAMQAMGLTPADYSMTNLNLLFGRYPIGSEGYGDWWPMASEKAAYYYEGPTKDVGKVLPFL